jgi:hypothetical protein
MGETDFDKIGATGINLGAAQIIESELEQLDGVTPGTVAASKCVVPDSNKRVDTLVIGTLKLGAGAGTAITATAAEINKLAGAGAVVASGTQAAHIADPTDEASNSAAIASILNALEAFGITAAS